MSRLSDALVVMDKKSPSVEDFGIMDEATVPTLAWIKEALPYLEEMRKFNKTMLRSEFVSKKHKREIVKPELAHLDALIAQVKPEV